MSDSDPTASEENSTGKFEVRTTNDIRLRCDSMVEHVKHGPIHVDRVTHSPRGSLRPSTNSASTGVRRCIPTRRNSAVIAGA